MWSTGSSSPF